MPLAARILQIKMYSSDCKRTRKALVITGQKTIIFVEQRPMSSKWFVFYGFVRFCISLNTVAIAIDEPIVQLFCCIFTNSPWLAMDLISVWFAGRFVLLSLIVQMTRQRHITASIIFNQFSLVSSVKCRSVSHKFCVRFLWIIFISSHVKICIATLFIFRHE